MAKVLDEAFGIQHGLMTTVHAHERPADLDLPHGDLRRARALEHHPDVDGRSRRRQGLLRLGKLDGMAMRVRSRTAPWPIPPRRTGYVTVEQVNAAFKAASKKAPLKGATSMAARPRSSSTSSGTRSVIDVAPPW